MGSAKIHTKVKKEEPIKWIFPTMIVKKSLIQSSMGMFFYFDVVIDGEGEDQR